CNHANGASLLLILRRAMAAHFDARALTELTALIGLQNLSARFNAAMAIPAQGLCQMPLSVPAAALAAGG
ncbi:hypothetical protein FJ701_31185, partial [Klebsiella pneumoniae]